MGCSSSKLDDEEAVKLCKDRKRFIKQAVEQRARFASSHLAYIDSLKRVSAALRDYIEGDEATRLDLPLDSFVSSTKPKTKPSPNSSGFISISPKKLFESEPNSTMRVNYLRSGSNNLSVSVEELPPRSPETVRFEGYYDGGFFSYSPNRPSHHFAPPSPQTSQWDFFWNPFSSLDYYGYPNQNDRSSLDYNDIGGGGGLRRVREEEGIPDLEEDDFEIEFDKDMSNVNDCQREEVIVEDVDEDEDNEDGECEEEEEETEAETEQEATTTSVVEVSRSQAFEMCNDHQKAMDEMPGFTVYVNRRPTSIAEVVNELEEQFVAICGAANEVATTLEARRSQFYSSTSSEITVKKILNPVALIRSASSSRSSSSRFAVNSSSFETKEEEEEEEDSGDISEQCAFSGSHQSTLDRLYAWEKKLYDEVRSGEKVRIAYEKKCMQLRNHDAKGDDPSSVEKTRAVLRDLHTRIKVSIHSVEAISKRIKALRDDELQPQLLELVKGLSSMWKVMAESHKSQKRTLDEAKLLLMGTPSKLESRKHSHMSVSEPQRVARSASNLESELKNWRACFESWIASQRSYARSLSGWLLRCAGRPDDPSKPLPQPPFSLPIVFGACIEWSRSLDAAREAAVLDGLEFFAAGMGSLYAPLPRVVAGSGDGGGGGVGDKSMEIVEIGREVEDAVMTAEKMAEVAIRLLCAGMSVAVNALIEFSVGSAKGYSELLGQWESDKWRSSPNEALGL